MAQMGRPKKKDWFAQAVKKIAVRRVWRNHTDYSAAQIAAICGVTTPTVYSWTHFIERDGTQDVEDIRLAFIQEAPIEPKSAERLWHEALEKSFHITVPGMFRGLAETTAALRALYAITAPTTPKQDSAQ